ncbi:uncharacterized protein LOC124166069 [Ischnura elegans]|uniref:uncharacterized protein LOC124166069 n=1 Tax=Ischnura elegans TaxID=197161 RepID=UPI001ED870C4|nr:uncharacterized protein LOC124166069 [Ischnura elegans]
MCDQEGFLSIIGRCLGRKEVEELAAEGPIPEELETPGADVVLQPTAEMPIDTAPSPLEAGRPSTPASPPPGEGGLVEDLGTEQQGPARELAEVEEFPGPDLHRPSIEEFMQRYSIIILDIASIINEIDWMVGVIERRMEGLVRQALELRTSRNHPDGDGRFYDH